MNRYPQLSEFSTAFADAYRGFMTESRITGKQIAAKLDRNLGYVSERVNGKRALDTEDVDALAMLAGDGWTGRTLMIELSRRARSAVEEMNEGTGATIHHPNFGAVDDELAAASPLTEEDPDSGYDGA